MLSETCLSTTSWMMRIFCKEGNVVVYIYNKTETLTGEVKHGSTGDDKRCYVRLKNLSVPGTQLLLNRAGLS